MAYDLDLEYRIDELTHLLGEIGKKKMFGGICYLLSGNMCFAIHKNFLVIRTSKEKADQLMENEEFSPFDITGRPMKGWVMASPDVCETEEDLLELLKIGQSFAAKLPPK